MPFDGSNWHGEGGGGGRPRRWLVAWREYARPILRGIGAGSIELAELRCPTRERRGLMRVRVPNGPVQIECVETGELVTLRPGDWWWWVFE